MSRTARWTADQLPDLSGRTVIITGGNSGLGFEAARALAPRGAELVLACRDLSKAKAAIAEIEAEAPGAAVAAMQLDLASLASIRAFAESFLETQRQLHVLCNNAGVMAIPYRKTADGFEMQLGTNHLGHFALTALLLPRLLDTPGSRVVNVSSNAHYFGKMRFDDLHWERGYSKWRAYGQSKLANLLFTYELQSRLDAAGSGVLAAACHPGYAATNLQGAGARMVGSSSQERFWELSNRLLSQSAAMGALPTLYAAAAPQLRGGDYIGPDGWFAQAGHPTLARSSPRARDPVAAAKLWDVSESLTDTRFDALRR